MRLLKPRPAPRAGRTPFRALPLIALVVAGAVISLGTVVPGAAGGAPGGRGVLGVTARHPGGGGHHNHRGA
ncbi:hypothetical protein, partial [Kitasatospora sp. NPDC059817]|uniref:hypothetical protein n=1 Tax=Kitasatospora sp. NPDC059817 TaxID=3346961 RepID=UPI0036508C93